MSLKYFEPKVSFRTKHNNFQHKICTNNKRKKREKEIENLNSLCFLFTKKLIEQVERVIKIYIINLSF